MYKYHRLNPKFKIISIIILIKNQIAQEFIAVAKPLATTVVHKDIISYAYSNHA